MTSMLEDPSYLMRWKIRIGDTAAVRNLIKADQADPLQPSETVRGWAPLHIACWGTLKPQADKDIVEALLMWAQKKGKAKEDEIRAMADSEGLTALDLAKQRREIVAAQAPAANADEGGAGLEEKRKYDKIIEWLEKGLPAQ